MLYSTRSSFPPGQSIKQEPIKLEIVNESSASEAGLFLEAFGFRVCRAGKALLVGDLDIAKLQTGEFPRRIDLTLKSSASISFDNMPFLAGRVNLVEMKPVIRKAIPFDVDVLRVRNLLLAFSISYWDGYFDHLTEADKQQLAATGSK